MIQALGQRLVVGNEGDAIVFAARRIQWGVAVSRVVNQQPLERTADSIGLPDGCGQQLLANLMNQVR